MNITEKTAAVTTAIRISAEAADHTAGVLEGAIDKIPEEQSLARETARLVANSWKVYAEQQRLSALRLEETAAAVARQGRG